MINIKKLENQHFKSEFFEDINKISQSFNYFTPVLKNIEKIINFKSSFVLDLGCGTGVYLEYLIFKGCKTCYGVDSPSEYIFQAKNRGYKEIKTISDLNYKKIPFKKEFFDFIVSKDVFEHLLNPVFVLEEVKRTLKPKGFFLFHVPNHFPLHKRLKFLFNNNIDTYNFFAKESRWTYPHIRFYEYNDLLSVFNRHGFDLVINLNYHFLAIPFLSKFRCFFRFNKFLAQKFPNTFASGFTLLLRKK